MEKFPLHLSRSAFKRDEAKYNQSATHETGTVKPDLDNYGHKFSIQVGHLKPDVGEINVTTRSDWSPEVRPNRIPPSLRGCNISLRELSTTHKEHIDKMIGPPIVSGMENHPENVLWVRPITEGGQGRSRPRALKRQEV
ncbi:hypothetical protein Ddc_23899 [Ditylenchus destructor]|nr:hypothetical protein Ddc_23899 [Ditylenchus destructor]